MSAMTVEIPRDVRRRLPDDLPPEAITACLSLTGGLSEAHVVAADGRLVGFVKRSALAGLEAVELDPTRPPRVRIVSWQESLVLEAADGATIPIPLPTMDKARTRAGIAALYTALEAWDALYDLYTAALAGTRGRSERLALLETLGDVSQRLDPAASIEHWAAMLDLDPRNATATGRLRALYDAGHAAARDPLMAAHRARGEWDRAVALAADAARAVDDPEQRRARWIEVADKAARRLDDQALAVEALGHALAIRFDPALYERLDRLVLSTAAWAPGVAALIEATAGEGAPPADLWRRIAEIRGARLGDAEGAIAAWEQVHAADPEAEDALLALADVHRAAERWGPFLYTSRRALHLTDDLAARIRLLRAIAEVEQGPCERRDAAIEAWEALLAIAVYDPQALDALEALYAETGRWADLAGLLERRQQVAEAAMKPDEALTLLRRRARLTEDELDDVDRAIRLWREVRARAPASEAAEEAEARLDVLLTRAALWGALEALLATRAERLDRGPARGALHRRRALIFAEHLSDDDRAIAAWRAVLVDLPDDREALDALVALYRAQDRAEDLVAALESLVRVLPPDSPLRIDTWAELGRRLPAVGRAFDDTVRAWRSVLAADADHREALDALIALYQSADRAADAIPLLKRRAGLTGAIADLLLLGKLTLAVNATDEAAQIYARVLSSDPDCAPARAFLERYYAGRERWADLVELLRGATRLLDEPGRQLDAVLRIADIHLTGQRAPDRALDALAEAPAACFRDKRLTDAALRAAEAGGDWQRFLDDVESRARSDAADRETLMDGARRFAGGMLSCVRPDPLQACRLGAWFEAHAAPDRAVECYDAALAADRGSIDAWTGKRRALAVGRRWRMLAEHLESMARAPLPRADRAEALRYKADVLTRHINAPDEAASAAQRAVDLARPAGRFVAWAVVVLLLAAALAWAGYATA